VLNEKLHVLVFINSCILVFIQYYCIFRLSSSAVIKQDIGSRKE